MAERRSRAAMALGIGIGAALAVSLPLALLAQILDTVIEGGLPGAAATALAVAAMVGPPVGGFVVGRRHPSALRWAIGFLAGAVALGLVATLGAVRASADDDTDVSAAVVPGLALWGGVLGTAGVALGGRRAARTRP